MKNAMKFIFLLNIICFYSQSIYAKAVVLEKAEGKDDKKCKIGERYLGLDSEGKKRCERVQKEAGMLIHGVGVADCLAKGGKPMMGGCFYN